MRTGFAVMLSLVLCVALTGCSSSPVGTIESLADPEHDFTGTTALSIATVVGEEVVRRPTIAERKLLADTQRALEVSGFRVVDADQTSTADVLLFCGMQQREFQYDTFRTVPVSYQTYGYSPRKGKHFSETTYGQEVVPITARGVEIIVNYTAVERSAYEANELELPLEVLAFWTTRSVVDAAEFQQRKAEILLMMLDTWGTTANFPVPPVN
ncbi:MAG: hypothetical protein AAF432_15360 [Planctomycetota bacterium]